MTDPSIETVESNVRVWAVNPRDGVEYREASNVSCVGGHEFALDLMRPSTASDGATRFAVGTGGGLGTSVTDRTLNDQRATGRILSDSRQGRTATFRGFLPGQVSVQAEVDEVGLLTGEGGDLVNHAQIDAVEVSTNTVVVFETDLTFLDTTEA